MEDKKAFKRLSKSVQPTNYNIMLKPDLSKFTFTGTSTVDVEVKRESKKLTINSVDITVSTVKFSSADQALDSTDITYNKDDETVTFKFGETLKLGSGQLHLVFDGELNDKMKGFYRSKYTTPYKEERYCAVTQFEATDARRAFPCWDEPAVKATFEITIIAPKDRVVLSNMDVSSTSDEEESLQKVIFNKTPIMSTYLVAFIIGEFDYIEEIISNGVIIRVYTPLGKTEQGEFALKIAAKTIPYYEEYFKVKYPLPKMDLIAIPDFAAGAMENWGLVTYRETALLVDSKESSAAAKQWVALVVGHEIAHQWFGNLTTMEWWTHLWLNEGFATFVEYLCVDFCCPEYNIWTQFATADFTRALSLDALHNSHPIEVPVGHPSEIDEIFDAISYSKGACVIRMLNDYIGEEAFKLGLNTYLTEMQYRNATTEDLWYHLEKASKKPVAQIMTTWTSQMGFPVLSVSSEQIDSKRVLKISQKRFTADGVVDQDYKWAVPINITTSTNPQKVQHTVLMSDPEMVIFIENVPKDAWVKINPGQIGFYRTCYSAEMIKDLIPGISQLSPVDRLGVENDLFALAVAGDCNTTDFFDILSGYRNEDNYTVWNDLDSHLSTLSIIIQNTDYLDAFKKFVLALYKPLGDKLGWDAQPEEDHSTPLLRSLVINRLGKYGDEATVAEAQRRFKAHVNAESDIDANLRNAVYSIVACHGNEETFDEMIKLYRNTTHMEEQCRLMRCIGASDKKELIEKTLAFAMTDEVRAQDTVFTLTSTVGSLIGRKMTWQFIKDNWEELHKRYAGGFLLSRLIMRSTEDFATEEDAKDVEAFFEAHKVPSGERTVKQSIENIHLNIGWLKRDQENISQWLQKNL